MPGLIGLELVTEMVKTCVLSGRLAGGFKPVSLLIIAAPESGKTSVVKEQDCEALQFFTDMTGRGLMAVLQQCTPALSHVVINDMVSIMSHRVNVNRYLISILNAITEEGMDNVAYPGIVEKFNKTNLGVIASLTHDLARDGRAWWSRTGFATRMLPFAFDHTPDLEIRIKAAIINGSVHQKKRLPKDTLKIPKDNLLVKCSPKNEERVLRLSNVKAVELEEKGYRRLNQYRSLVRAHALLRCQGKVAGLQVTEDDIDFLQAVQPFIQYKRCIPL